VGSPRQAGNTTFSDSGSARSSTLVTRNGGTVTDQTGRLLAQVGFLLIVFSGIWLVAAQIPFFRLATMRTIVAGIALALGGVLLIVATRWGRFG